MSDIKCNEHVALPKLPINKLKLDQQNREQVLKTYCSNVYTVCKMQKAFLTWSLPFCVWHAFLKSSSLVIFNFRVGHITH